MVDVLFISWMLERINAQLRKVIETRTHFPNDGAATKPIWLALRSIAAKSGSAAHDWKSAMNPFAILYGDRLMGPA